MANIGKHFMIDTSKGKSLDGAIKKGSFYRITILTERLIRLEYSKKGVFNDLPTDFAINRSFDLPKYDFEEDDKYLIINTKYFNLQYLKESTFKGPSFAPETNLKIKLNNTDKYWYYDHPEARNYKGSSNSLDNFNGINKKLQNGLYSTDGFVSIKDNNSYILSDQGLITKSEDEYIDMYVFMYKRDFGLCLKDYFQLTGYPLLIPRYSLGIWWYKDLIYSQSDIERLINKFDEEEIPLSVLLLGEFWHEKNISNYDLRKTGYTFSKKLFPDTKLFMDNIHAKGIKLGLNIDPIEGVNPYDEAYPKFKEEFNLKDNQNIPFNVFDKMFIICYFEYLINPLTSMDIDFFWLDYKKDYNVLRALDFYHIMDCNKNEYKRPMLFTRNSGVAAHRNGILYSGETIVSWNTLKYLPYYNSSACNIGLSWWSHDVGGFKDGIEDSELYMRYIQFSTFSPIFRFSSKRGPYYKREPWLWDYKTYNITKYYTQLRHKLIPYIYSEGYNYSKNGLPLIQPLYYNYPETFDEPNYRNEYYFGRDLFVSPITTQKDRVMDRVIQRLFLPKGVWYDFRNGKKFMGGKRYICFYKDEDYPVFVKAGSVIPLANTTNKINLVDNPETLDINVFPGKNGTFKLYEDDGMTSLYKQGYYNITSMDYNYEVDNYSLSIRPAEGNVAVLPNYRNYNIIFKNTKDVLSVKVTANGANVDYRLDQDGNDFIVSFDHIDTSKEVIVRISGKAIDIDSMQLINEDLDSIINDLKIKTSLKEAVAKIVFSNLPINKKRIEIKKLRSKGLEPAFIKMLINIYTYLEEV